MTVQLLTKTVYHCQCRNCGWEWDALVKPARCAKCKARTWNGEDRRLPDPFFDTANNSRIENYKKPPALRVKPLYATLSAARNLIAEVIEQNPCGHAEDKCNCNDKQVLADLDRQIEAIGLLAGKRKGIVTASGKEA